MKNIIITFLIVFVLFGCSTSSVVDPQPTGYDSKDVYLQEWVTSYNVTFCEKVLDLENHLDGYFCLETMTDNKYYVPLEEWEKNNFEVLFLRVSKAQIRAKMDQDAALKDYICKEASDVKCKGLGTPNVMSEIQPWKEE